MSNRTDAGHVSGKQDYGTPANFLAAVTRRFGHLVWDLAASDENHKAACYITEAQDSLSKDWGALTPSGNCWLNPPFGRIAPWAEKCAKAHRRILFLVPVSIGSDWYAKWVFPYAATFALRGRLTFEGCSAPFPKDCILAAYGFSNLGFDPGDFDVWDWRH